MISVILSWTQSQKFSLELIQCNYSNKRIKIEIEIWTLPQSVIIWQAGDETKKNRFSYELDLGLCCRKSTVVWNDKNNGCVPLSKSKPNQNFTFQDKSNSKSIFSTVPPTALGMSSNVYGGIIYWMTFYNCTWCKNLDGLCFFIH